MEKHRNLHIPPVRSSLLLHIKEHGKEDALDPEPESNQRKKRGYEQLAVLHKFMEQGEDATDDPAYTEHRPEDIEKYQGVEVQNHVLHLQPPEEIMEEKTGEFYDIRAVFDPRFFSTVA